MKTVLVTGNFDGEIQAFFFFFFRRVGEEDREGDGGREGEILSFGIASRERRSVFILFII